MSMRVLLVKISALGDLVHVLPAVSDARRAHPLMRLEWLVEENLAELPTWHPGVDRVHLTALRRWRRDPFSAASRAQAAIFLRALRGERHHRVVDAQGLLKSAVLASLAHGPVVGPAADWVRERYALPFYRYRVAAPDRHVVQRLRRLMAVALDYPLPADPPDFGLGARRIPPLEGYTPPNEYVLLLHGTAWSSKLWPREGWQQVAKAVTAQGLAVVLPWGNEEERQRAEWIARGSGAQVAPRLPLGQMARVILGARAVVGLDSGLAHLAAALGQPCVTLFGATDPEYSGIAGPKQRFIQADHPCAPCMQRTCTAATQGPVNPPCFQSVPPERVLAALKELL